MTSWRELTAELCRKNEKGFPLNGRRKEVHTEDTAYVRPGGPGARRNAGSATLSRLIPL